jgi:protein-tyrosine phosphatase
VDVLHFLHKEIATPAIVDRMNDVFRLAFVCTGNRFRSVLAAALMRRLVGTLPVRVASCGILDLGALPPLAEAVEVGRRLGLDLGGHRTCHLGATDLSQADLVLGFEREHVAEAAVTGSAPASACFLFGELVSLASRLPAPSLLDPVERAKEVVARADAARRAPDGFVPNAEIPDPWGADLATAERITARVVSGCEAVSDALFGPSSTRDEARVLRR